MAPTGDGGRPLPPPDTISTAATLIWLRLAPLVPQGRLTPATSDLFAMLCTQIATWQEADQLIQANGILTIDGPDLTTSPALSIRDHADTMTARWAKAFGLVPDTPAQPSRDRQMRHLRQN